MLSNAHRWSIIANKKNNGSKAIFRKKLVLQKISTCSLTHDVSSLEDDNIKSSLLIFILIDSIIIFESLML
jgi:hypothetical protein